MGSRPAHHRDLFQARFTLAPSFLTCLLLWGCAQDTARCVQAVSAPLYHASEDPEGLRISLAEQRAVGAIEDGLGQVHCTGTLIAPGWVLTAAHCETPSGVWFRAERVEGPPLRIAAPRRFVHPTRDLMLLQLEGGTELDIEGVGLWRAIESQPAVGDDVTIVGLGETETGTRGSRRFIHTQISEMTTKLLETDGDNRRGACSGDSGGPLLRAMPEGGGVAVLGVLSRGSASCVGRDIFERADSLAAWVDGVIASARLDPCGTLTRAGDCSDGHAVWCDAGEPRFQTCDRHRVCGWSIEAEGYRCIPVQHDPCEGAGPRGRCSDFGNSVLQCVAGALIETPCSPCAQRCNITVNGLPECQETASGP